MDRRPYYVLAGVAAALLLALALPQTRAWLADDVGAPLVAQAEGEPAGYSLGSLAFWAILGLALAWPAYDIVFVRLKYAPDRSFFLALAPFLLAAPLAHALLVVGAIPSGSLVAYAATEPPIYLTTGLLVIGALALGRLLKQAIVPAIVLGVSLIVGLLLLALPRLDAGAAGKVGLILLLALVPAVALAYGYTKVRPQPREPFDALLAIVGAHALDGATTWMVLRDPFGIGFVGFAEKNPVSLFLVNLSNGWPFFALKLALPLLLLTVVRTDDGDERTRRFLLFAIFVLGYGPGMSNLLQVLLG